MYFTLLSEIVENEWKFFHCVIKGKHLEMSKLHYVVSTLINDLVGEQGFQIA